MNKEGLQKFRPTGGVIPEWEYTRKVPLPSTLVGTEKD